VRRNGYSNSFTITLDNVSVGVAFFGSSVFGGSSLIARPIATSQ